MVLDIPAAQQALKDTATLDGLVIEGNNRKISQLLSLHGHLEAALYQEASASGLADAGEVTPAQCVKVMGRDASAKERRAAVDGLVAYATRLEGELEDWVDVTRERNEREDMASD